MDTISRVRAEIERLKAKYRKDMYKSNYEGLASGYKIEAYNELLSFLDTLEEESVDIRINTPTYSPISTEPEKDGSSEKPNNHLEHVPEIKETGTQDLDELINSYLEEHRHDVLLSPYNGLMEFAKLVCEWQKKHMEGLDEDIITLHLGKILPDEQYDEVVRSVVAFMNQRWPNCKVGVDN